MPPTGIGFEEEFLESLSVSQGEVLIMALILALNLLILGWLMRRTRLWDR